MLEVLVPDVGEATEVEVIEVLIKVGDWVDIDDSLVVLESDKASMEIPSPFKGNVMSVSISVGDLVEEGGLLMKLSNEAAAETSEQKQVPDDSGELSTDESSGVAKNVSKVESKPGIQANNGPSAEHLQTVAVPDVGDAGEVTVTEILVKVGDLITADSSVIVLESDKASMEIPTPYEGVVDEILVRDGDEVKEGDGLIRMMVQTDAHSASENARTIETARPESASPTTSPEVTSRQQTETPRRAVTVDTPMPSSKAVHAGPAVRKLAREFGVELDKVVTSGRNGRILKEDVQTFVKQRLSVPRVTPPTAGSGIPVMPDVDFTKFGEIELAPMSRIQQASARNLHRAWLNVPHVTQFDEADITELEEFRKQQNTELARDGLKLTPLAFLVKALVQALKTYPRFNASIEPTYKNMILKKYYNIGIAVETPDGLVVPVIKHAEQMGIIELSQECGRLAGLAREKKLPLDAMQGASFTISSLGGIGGTKFTPIVNAPEVAILGVSRSKISPIWDGNNFVPRTMLPLSLSYDHRAIDGAEAARFTNYLGRVLTDLRRLLL